MGKIIVNQYLITNPKITSDKKIGYASDLHSDITKSEETIEEPETAKATAEEHVGFFGAILNFFKAILNFFKSLFS